MKARYISVFFSICLFMACGNTKLLPEADKEEERISRIQELRNNFTKENFLAVFNNNYYSLLLCDKKSEKTIIDGVVNGYLAMLHVNTRKVENGLFSIDVASSMYPAMLLDVEFSREGINVKYWVNDLVIIDEYVVIDHLNKKEVDRFTKYEGFIDKNQLIDYLLDSEKKRNNHPYNAILEQTFYVMQAVVITNNLPAGFTIEDGIENKRILIISNQVDIIKEKKEKWVAFLKYKKTVLYNQPYEESVKKIVLNEQGVYPIIALAYEYNISNQQTTRWVKVEYDNNLFGWINEIDFSLY